MLVSRSLRAQGDLPRAERELAARISRTPDSAPLHLEMGWLAFQRKEAKAARQSFEEALRLQPTLHDARVGLVTLDIAEKRFDAARGRVGEWQQAPADPRLKILSARIDLAAGKTAEAEHTLRALVTADPSQLDAYDLLGRIAMSQGQLDRAMAEYRTLAERTKPPAGPLTLVGMIRRARGDRDGGATAIRKGHGDRSARRRRRQQPGVDVCRSRATGRGAEARDGRDRKRCGSGRKRRTRSAGSTTGKGSPPHAVAAFERAVAKSPDNPVYPVPPRPRAAEGGNDPQGRAALKRALAMKSDFSGADEARKALAETSAGK